MSHPNDSLEDYYNEGLEAAHDGKLAATCPYEYDSPKGMQWMAGFYDGGGDD
jgi:ribosome modulation factor